MAITKPVMKQHANKCSALYLCSDNCKSTQLFKPMQTFQHSSGQSKHLTSSHILWLIYTHTIQWWFSIFVILLRRVTLKTNIKCGYCVTFVTLSLSKSAVIVNKIQQKINTPSIESHYSTDSLAQFCLVFIILAKTSTAVCAKTKQ